MVLVLLVCSAFLIVAPVMLITYLQLIYNHMRKVKVPLTTVVTPNKKDIVVQSCPQAPGPFPLPILGNLALLGSYEAPFIGLTELTKTYGDIYSLTLGSTRCLVVNNLELIREVLNQNGKFFGGRPNFLRYNKLFGGDRNNSLALCDWSNLQQKRRNLARRHCSPRDTSSYFMKMSEIGQYEAQELMVRMREQMLPGEAYPIKPLIQQACANMFMQYMCSLRFDYDDCEFNKIVENFDEIFWEINQGYAVDFLPWLAPFYKQHIKKIVGWSTSIRKFILERIINTREQNLDLDEAEKDFTDALLKNLTEDEDVTRDTIIFMLEDFIGGHSAVGNLVMLALTYIAKHPHIAVKIQAEADRVVKSHQRQINLYDMTAMPITMATIFEVLRYSSSPIVPHVATEDAAIAGYGVPKGTVVFINNYKLNTSTEYWSNPEVFDPERFLEKTTVTSKTMLNPTTDGKRRHSEGSDSGIEYEREAKMNGERELPEMGNNNRINSTTTITSSNNNHIEYDEHVQVKKNIPHFLPFSIGKRTCIGQNLVRGFGFIVLANIIHRYNVSIPTGTNIQIDPACVALPAKTFPLIFTERTEL